MYSCSFALCAQSLFEILGMALKWQKMLHCEFIQSCSYSNVTQLKFSEFWTLNKYLKSLRMCFRNLKLNSNKMVMSSQNDRLYCKCSSKILVFPLFFGNDNEAIFSVHVLSSASWLYNSHLLLECMYRSYHCKYFLLTFLFCSSVPEG